MDDYQKIVANESILKQLYRCIYQHRFFKKEAVLKDYLEQFSQKLQVLQQKIDFFESKRKLHKNLLGIEQEKLHFHSKNIVQVKDQSSYFRSKAEKQISEKFIQKYQNKMNELGMEQKQVQQTFQQLLGKKNDASAQLMQEKQIFDKETQDSKLEYNALLIEQKNAVKNLAIKFQTQFLQLHAQSKFPAVVAVKEAYCPECAIVFPPQVFQEVLEVSYAICPNCNRILIVDAEYFNNKK